MDREEIKTAQGYFDVLRFPDYNKQVQRFAKKEPRLHALVIEEIQNTLNNKTLKPIPGLGGWAKVRIPAPTMRIGKSGGFRAIFLCLNVGGTIYLATVYFKSEKADLTTIEKRALAQVAVEIKKR